MFDRTFAQLKPFYSDLRAHLPPSAHEHHVLALNLLRLLTQNAIAAFHVEVELLSAEARATPFVQHATQLEQQLMEGLYSKALAGASGPSPHSAWFMEVLAETVRDEVASCCAAVRANGRRRGLGGRAGVEGDEDDALRRRAAAQLLTAQRVRRRTTSLSLIHI